VEDSNNWEEREEMVNNTAGAHLGAIDGNYSGEITKETSDGDHVTISYLNGKKHGITKFISSRGIVQSEISYEDDVIHGDVRQYYPNGELMVVMTYVNGVQTGRFISYHTNGMKQVEANYDNGELHGSFRTFDEFGDVIVEMMYARGQRNGESLLYYPKVQGGGVCESSIFRDGLLEGDKMTFSPSGKVMSVTRYKAGKAQAYPQYFNQS
jgi:antitoxin component YwqK of YwqJK toxin-antitoxin module